MSMTKYGARPEQTSKTASGSPGTRDPKLAETERLERKKDETKKEDKK